MDSSSRVPFICGLGRSRTSSQALIERWAWLETYREVVRCRCNRPGEPVLIAQWLNPSLIEFVFHSIMNWKIVPNAFLFLMMGRAISCCPHEVSGDPDVVCHDVGQPCLLDPLVGLHPAIHQPRRSSRFHNSRGKLRSVWILTRIFIVKPLLSKLYCDRELKIVTSI